MKADDTYDLLIQTLPHYKCPDGFTERVIKTSGICQQSRNNTHSRPLTTLYATACIITLMLLLATIQLGIRNGAVYQQEQLAANTVTMAEHLSNSFKVAFIFERGHM